ncbi:MAG TPA: aminotransferase class I/II-fold pyridoxal phosphate-dependent enzyme [Bryobacteraceae bacterium]|jgi:aspartate/methionine/tyrosine aminotransferase|nr:aminotransferase class I/II-fold pyridoxal phosphate-dependent enzyme [Bryobacteraceae bacterium]
MASVAEKSLLSPPDIGEHRPRFRSQRTTRFTESVIREMTRLAAQHNAVNLAQGFPDFGSPEVLRKAACDAINADINQYAITWGSKSLRNAIAAKYKKTYNLEFDPEREITVCCGATEGMMASLMAVTNPGDEVVIFEPYYENYGPDTLLAGADRKFVKMRPPDWRFDREELRRAFSPRTKAIILCSPNNPTGRVFDRGELEYIAQLCQEFDCLAITDEIYEHILYDGTEHIPIMSLPGMRNRTILINSMSKTYAVTGWRIGWVLAAPDLSDSIRKIHDFLTVGSSAPLQEASAVALALPEEYYTNLARDYRERRDAMLKVLEETGFRSFAPRGAYYVLCDISGFGYADDMAFCRHLVEDVGIAAVPGSSFFEDPKDGSQLVRFCFCKKYETLREAQERLRKI